MHRSVHRIFGRTRATVIGAALLSGAALPAAGLWAGTASAAPTCTVTAGVTTCTFAYTGHATSFQVPVGVTALAVVADGGAGANAVSSYIHGGGAGGKGGEYKATLTGVTPGSTLSIFPGGAASGTTGGVGAGGGGGSGATDSHGTSGGGGGQSTVSIAPFSVGNVLVAAGGGGGGGAENFLSLTPATGGTGGGSSFLAVGGSGHPLANIHRGRGGTTAVGGLNGGTTGCTVSATSGTQFKGGNSNSGTCALAGGAGGGGYFGGGGAAEFAGGGGGSGYPLSTGVTVVHGITITPVTDLNTNPGNGVVTIKYIGEPPTTTHLSSSHDPSFFGLPVTFTATVAPLDGGVFDGGGTVTFKDGIFAIPGCSAVTLHHIFGTWRAFCTTSALHVGPNIITATYNGDSHWAGSFSNPVLQLVLRAPTHLTPHIVFNVLQTFTVSGTLTSFGHPVAGAFLTFSTGPFTLCHAFTNSHGIGFCFLTYNQSVLIRQQAGRYRVSYAGSPGYFPSIGLGQAIIHP